RLEVLCIDAGNVERTHLAAALHKGNDGVLVRVPTARLTAASAILLAVESLVSLNDLAAAAKRAGLLRGHGGTDAVRHEPRGFVAHAKHALKLLAAHAFLGRAEKVDRVDPLVEGNLGVLKNRPDRDRELSTAIPAEQKARTVRRSVQAAIALRSAAVRA